MKITVAEWNEFCVAWDALPGGENWYVDSEDDVDDQGNPNTKIEVCGELAWQGEGEPVPVGFLGEHSLATAIRKWRKERDFVFVVVEVPRDRINEVEALLRDLGCKAKGLS